VRSTRAPKPLAQAKAKLSKVFKWSKAQCLYDAVALAVLLHAFRRDDEALEVCRAVDQIQFDGKYTLWSAVENALTLQSRLLRLGGSDECPVERMEREWEKKLGAPAGVGGRDRVVAQAALARTVVPRRPTRGASRPR